MNFDQAFDLLITYEGGYSDHALDPGGKTRWGVTEAVARRHGYVGDMKNFPKDKAKAIYKEAYWDAVKADLLPVQIRYATFDAAVNSGVSQSIKWLQNAARVSEDGVLGPKTLAAAQAVSVNDLLSVRLVFMTGLPSWPAFGKGWARRIAHVMRLR